VKVQLQMQMKLLRIINMDFDVAAQLLIVYPAFIKCLKQQWEYTEAVQ